MTRLYTANPSESGTGQWYVWDMYKPLPPQPVFVGSMEDAISVSDALNKRMAEEPGGELKSNLEEH